MCTAEETTAGESWRCTYSTNFDCRITCNSGENLFSNTSRVSRRGQTRLRRRVGTSSYCVLADNPPTGAPEMSPRFTKNDSDTSWLASLPRAASPPPPIARITLPQSSATSNVVPSARSSLTSPPPETLKMQITTLHPDNMSLKAEMQALESSTSNEMLPICIDNVS